MGKPPRPGSNQGAVSISKVVPFQCHVVRDGRLITGQNPLSATGVGERMLEALRERG